MSNGSAFSYYLRILVYYSDRILMRLFSSLLILLQVNLAAFLLIYILISNKEFRPLFRLFFRLTSVF